MDIREVRLIDIHKPEIVQIELRDGKVWVNVDGICMLRAMETKLIIVEDNRTKIEGS